MVSIILPQVDEMSQLISSRVLPLAYELLIMGLAMYKAVKFWKASAGFSGLRLIKVIMMDQVMTFAL